MLFLSQFGSSKFKDIMEIVHASVWERVKLCFLAVVFGWYLVLRRLLKWAWNPNQFFVLRPRDKPPPCLVDNTFGKHSYIKLKGIKFHYVEAGNKEKPLILLLHGFPDCWLSWREQIPILSEYYRVVALDLKGFGDSDKPLNKSSYRIETLIDELKQFILSLGEKSCSIIGHDLGGLLGWYMAAIHQDVVCKLICISSPHPNFYWNTISGETIFSRNTLPFLPEIDVLKEDLAVINDTYKHLQLTEQKSNKDYVEAYKYAFSRKEDWTGPINYYRNLPYTRLGRDGNQQITTKTLLIVGNADPYVSLENIIQSTEYVEKCNVKVVSGAGHFPHQEKPQFVNESIIKFLVVINLISLGQLVEKTAPTKSIVSSWLGSLSTTVKYGNQVFDAVHKRTNGVVPLSRKVPEQTTT
ncbi:epoxide hydrolase 4-like isoform X2 [Copidosoma floridanum]|uniref:epoxide hydrolase 4-like isoform X2 n=1 Tax=Copidosoma floridanum TaxID=29053 RepID=UPI0006C94A9A|nr:epoxide hydrolase 4-like isoform X2 [Copidosoma floridanum]